jgi:ATP-dependent Clp protease ATP-binding subunit ClpC
LAQAWTRGSPRTVLVVSPHTHARLVHWLPAAADTLDVVHVGALEGDDLIEATAAAAPRILEQHGVELGRDAKIGELVRLADRYLTGLAMPGRGLDLLDLAAARARRCGRAHISRQLWIEIVSERSGLPPGRIETRGDADVLDLEQRIARRVVGHEDAIATIAGLIRRNRAGFGGQRPILTALLLGPSGVGKTELAKSLCSSLYERDDALVRLDMSEYSESHAVARIVGAPPGYVGHDSGGALSEALLARPHCVVLLDEIEKAHREVHQLLLQVFDEGRLTDGRGRIVDFRHAALVMTSNLGAERSATGAAAVLEVAKAAFPIELWNRIEAPLVMEPLGAAEMAKICRRLAAQSSDRLFRERGIRYALTQRACDHLCEMAGEDASLGARPLRHLLTREVEGPLADAILRGRLRAGTQVQIDVREGRIVIG